MLILRFFVFILTMFLEEAKKLSKIRLETTSKIKSNIIQNNYLKEYSINLKI